MGLQISFDDVTDSPIAATAQDYATAMTIYRMIERDEASKIMVFCWRNEDCRRCLALFNLLLKQRISEASHNRGLADRLREVRTAHIYATWQRNERTDEMEEHVKKRLLHQFKMGKIEVLFNANYLSTGIDIPCTDAVVLTQKSKGVRQVLQRWGRALRSIATQPSKRGILAIIMSDPEEPDEDKTKRKEFMGFDLALNNDFGGCHADFCNMYRTAECAAHRSNRIIGECDKIKAVRTTVRRRAHRDSTDTKKTPTFPPPVETVTPDVERTLRDMFDINVRDLLKDVDSQPSQGSLEHQDSDLVGSLASMGIQDERDGSQSESDGDSEHRSLADIQRDLLSRANDGSAQDADATIARRAAARRPPRADRLTEAAPEERAIPAQPRGQTTRPGAPQGPADAGVGMEATGGDLSTDRRRCLETIARYPRAPRPRLSQRGIRWPNRWTSSQSHRRAIARGARSLLRRQPPRLSQPEARLGPGKTNNRVRRAAKLVDPVHKRSASLICHFFGAGNNAMHEG